MNTSFIIVVLAAAVISNIRGVLSPSPSLPKEKIQLQCLHNFIFLKIDLDDIPNIKPSSLRLRQLSCEPYYVANNSAFFRVPFRGCGTTRGTKGNYISFSNTVENSARSLNESHVVVSNGLKLHVPFTCYYRSKYTITVQETEGAETRNHSARKQKSEGHATRSSPVPVESSSDEKVMPLTYSIVSVTFLSLSPIFNWHLLHLPQSGRRTPARFDLKGGGRRKETSLQKTVFYMINWWCLRAHVSLLKSRKNQNKTKRGGEHANFFLSQSSSRLAHVTSFSYLVLVLQALQESFFRGPSSP